MLKLVLRRCVKTRPNTITLIRNASHLSNGVASILWQSSSTCHESSWRPVSLKKAWFSSISKNSVDNNKNNVNESSYDHVRAASRFRSCLEEDSNAEIKGLVIPISQSEFEILQRQDASNGSATKGWLDCKFKKGRFIDLFDTTETETFDWIAQQLPWIESAKDGFVAASVRKTTPRITLFCVGTRTDEEDEGGSSNLTALQSSHNSPFGDLQRHLETTSLSGGTYGVLLPPWNIVSQQHHEQYNEDILCYLLGAYKFDRYKAYSKNTHGKRQIRVIFSNQDDDNSAMLRAIARATYLTRDLISTPAVDMTPGIFQEVAHQVVEVCTDNSSSGCKTSIDTIIGTELLSYNGNLRNNGHGCGMIYAVGKAAATSADDNRANDDRAPRLIHMSHKPVIAVDENRAKVALVGKGVTFDTGGLNLKPGNSMLLMKKDMGGAAHVLGLFMALVEMQVPLEIDCWIPAVENVIDANSYRPGDVLRSVNGITTEIGNTDAEGRLVLGDALALASANQPDIIVDFATLTGAARVAMGKEVPPFFCNRNELADKLMQAAMQERDPMWRLPLWHGYEQRIKTSKVADLNNVSSDDGLGGAITAALYLKEFVGATQKQEATNKSSEGTAKDLSIPWIHVDAYGINALTGLGEAQGLRTMFRFLRDNYGTLPPRPKKEKR